MSKRYAAIFFDVDGTLISELAGEHEARLAAGGAARKLGLCDAEPAEFADASEAAFAELMDKYGHTWPPGITDSDWIRRALEQLGSPGVEWHDLVKVGSAYKEEWLRHTAAVKGAQDAVESGLRLGPIAVITNYTEPEQQRGKLKAAGLAGYFKHEHVFISVEIGHSKPEPGIFKHAADVLGVAVEECVHIGNSWETDIKGALGAGADAIWFEEDARPGVQSRDPRVPRFESMAEVAAHLER